MSKILRFDAFNGASGDMILGALLDLGLPLEFLMSELEKLELSGYKLVATPVERQGLRGINFKVACPEGSGGPSMHRHLPDICSIISKADLDPWVKEHSVAVFELLGRAEAEVHGTPLEKVHFHEVGAVDSIIDIVGACVGFKYFGVEQFSTSPLALGGGTVTFSHGSWPVPAPATALLLKELPTYYGPVDAELTTPTGAAIVSAFAASKETSPAAVFGKSGFGAGDREFKEIPNMLRLMLGEMSAPKSQPDPTLPEEEDIVVLEAAIDDMDAETLGYFSQKAMEKGALDVYYAPLVMKKGRPGVLLSLLCRESDRAEMASFVFDETTTLGLRWKSSRRWVLDRETVTIETEFGPVRVKVGRVAGRIVNIAPEYEDLKHIAEREKLPLKEVRRRVSEHLARLES